VRFGEGVQGVDPSLRQQRVHQIARHEGSLVRTEERERGRDGVINEARRREGEKKFEGKSKFGTEIKEKNA